MPADAETILQEFSFFTPAGLQDILWCALLLGMILTWRRSISRAVLFGLACSHSQQPWLIRPFLMILLWNEGGSARERAVRGGFIALTSTGVLLLTNLPFMILDPAGWLARSNQPWRT
jgi:uncharacterized membrane protein